jgi:hypothetical protein
MNVTPRYSVCNPPIGDGYPTVVLDTNNLTQALTTATGGQIVYDWTTGKTVHT